VQIAAHVVPFIPSVGPTQYGGGAYGQSQTNQQSTPDQNAKLAVDTMPSGPIVNHDDGALMRSTKDGTVVSATSVSGNTASYYEPSDSFSLQLPSGAEFAFLPHEKIGLDENGTEVAVDDQGNTELFAPETNGRWLPEGPLWSWRTQKILGRYFDRQAMKYLNDANTFHGNLGYLSAYEHLGLGPTTLKVLAEAQQEHAEARQKELAQAAQAPPATVSPPWGA
jgi:hypothetical protein